MLGHNLFFLTHIHGYTLDVLITPSDFPSTSILDLRNTGCISDHFASPVAQMIHRGDTDTTLSVVNLDLDTILPNIGFLFVGYLIGEANPVCSYGIDPGFRNLPSYDINYANKQHIDDKRYVMPYMGFGF